MKAGPAAICEGKVWHRRNRPAVNEFTYTISHVWIDPDDPSELTDRHRLWSSTGAAPGRVRLSDYGMKCDDIKCNGMAGNGESAELLSDQIRTAVTPVLGYRPSGAIRMLSQPRRWGWMFNPITVFVLWHDDPDRPAAAVAEVTNTPWKERTHYPVALHDSSPDTGGDTVFSTVFDKTLHVSPFLHEDFHYRLTITDRAPDLEVRIDVCVPGQVEPIVETAMRVSRAEPTASALTRALVRGALSTRVVSFGIHAQAARLAAKRVPFVSHPAKRSKEDLQ